LTAPGRSATQPSERHRLKPSFDSKRVAGGASASIDAKTSGTERHCRARRQERCAARRTRPLRSRGRKVSATRRPRRSTVKYSRATGVMTKSSGRSATPQNAAAGLSCLSFFRSSVSVHPITQRTIRLDGSKRVGRSDPADWPRTAARLPVCARRGHTGDVACSLRSSLQLPCGRIHCDVRIAAAHGRHRSGPELPVAP